MNRVSQNPRVLAPQQDAGRVGDWLSGVRVHNFFCFWLSVNSPSSPVNGYSEGRWPMANVGVYSYISTKASSTSSEFSYSVSVFCGSARIIFYLTHAKMILLGEGMLLARIWLFFLFSLVLASLLWILLALVSSVSWLSSHAAFPVAACLSFHTALDWIIRHSAGILDRKFQVGAVHSVLFSAMFLFC